MAPPRSSGKWSSHAQGNRRQRPEARRWCLTPVTEVPCPQKLASGFPASSARLRQLHLEHLEKVECSTPPAAPRLHGRDADGMSWSLGLLLLGRYGGAQAADGISEDSSACAAFVDDYVYQTAPPTTLTTATVSPLETKYSALRNKTCAAALLHVPVSLARYRRSRAHSLRASPFTLRACTTLVTHLCCPSPPVS